MQCDQALLQLKQREVCEVRMKKYRSTCNTLRRLCGGDLDATLADMEKTEGLVGKIRRSHYSPETRSSFFIILKMLWKVANGYDLADQPKEIRWLKCGVSAKDVRLPKDLITDAEIAKMLAVCGLRQRAVLMLLFEGGLRVSEICALRKDCVEFVKVGARVHVPEGTKTGARSVLVIDSVPALAAWLSAHPRKDAHAPLFTGRNSGEVGGAAIRKMLRETAVKAGITRRIYPHLFRHTSATRLAKFLTEAQMKAYFGWTASSQMAARYVHLSGRDVDPGILAMHNRPVEVEKKIDAMEPKICDRCGKTNMHDVKMCGYCGLPFDKEKAKRQEMEIHEQLRRMRLELDELKAQRIRNSLRK